MADELQIYFGEPGEVLPFMAGLAHVVIADVTRDLEGRWRDVVNRGWIEGRAKRLLVVTSSQQDPRPVLGLVEGPFVGAVTVTKRFNKVVRSGVEHGFVIHVFGSPPAVNDQRPFMPAHHQLSVSTRDWDEYHEAMREWALKRLVGLHETVLDTNGDDGEWTRSSVQRGLRTIAVLQDEDNAEALQLLSTRRYLFDPDWLEDVEDQLPG